MTIAASERGGDPRDKQISLSLPMQLKRKLRVHAGQLFLVREKEGGVLFIPLRVSQSRYRHRRTKK
jgi:hypothetical protein